MKKRLFLAIQLPEEIIDAFAELIRSCQKADSSPGIRWTPRENLHITVYFLGYVDESNVAVIIEKTRAALANFKSLELEFKQIEFAPPNRPARMIWAVFDGRQYKLLVDIIYEALKSFSVRDFRGKEEIAHVTLARFNSPSFARTMRLKQPDIKNKIFKVNSIDVMESRLSPKGPTYKVVSSLEIKGYLPTGDVP